jgi:hypothetical protein
MFYQSKKLNYTSTFLMVEKKYLHRFVIYDRMPEVLARQNKHTQNPTLPPCSPGSDV